MLPTDLDALVTEDNKRFATEISEWDAEQQRRAQAGSAEATPSESPRNFYINKS